MSNFADKYLSSWFDRKPPDVKVLNQGAMATTAIGLIAGLAITAFLVVAKDLVEFWDLFVPRTLFSAAVAGLFATSAFGRAKTHFAVGKYYDFWQIVFDIPMVISGAALVGLLTRTTFAFDGWTWWWLGTFLLFLNVRNVYLSFRHNVQGLRIGILCIGAGLAIDIVIGLFFRDSGPAARVFAWLGFTFVVIQFSVEQLWFFWKHKPPPQS